MPQKDRKSINRKRKLFSRKNHKIKKLTDLIKILKQI